MDPNRREKLIPEQQTYVVGLIVAVMGIVTLLLPGNESWHAAGPLNIGHGNVDCNECHTPAPGSFVGQAFNNMLDAVGLNESETYFIYEPAGNEQCLACHENPEDRHPVAKFMKPKFARARQTAGVQFCVSCHREHLGVRASVALRVCQNCHVDTVVEDDPLDIPHKTLIDDERWETCLGCHDFHGNHERKVPEIMSQMLTEEQIQRYLDGGKSPYGYRRLTVIQTMRLRKVDL
jgi:hypothetical protein